MDGLKRHISCNWLDAHAELIGMGIDPPHAVLALLRVLVEDVAVDVAETALQFESNNLKLK